MALPISVPAIRQAALITGAAGGIGSQLCAEFTQKGYHVIGTDIPSSRPSHLSEDVCADYVAANLAELSQNSDAMSDYVKQILYLLPREGDAPLLKVLINNAAVQILNNTDNATRGDWDATLNVNLLAPFFLLQRFLEPLERTHGSVINIGSVHSSATKPCFVAYATSKAAIVGLTQSLAVDLGARVRVNAICPAAIATPMLVDGFKGNEGKLAELEQCHPVGRIGQPQEVARLALFLASDDAGFITGSSFSIDGGISKRLHDPV